MVSPVIQRASCEARNATTEPTSSGWPIRLSTCMPRTKDLPSSVLTVRHVGVDHARRDRVNPDAARPERRREVLHQRVDRALRGRVGRQGADGGVRPEGRDKNHAAAVAEYGKQLLHQEIWRADIDREELIEILDGHFL